MEQPIKPEALAPEKPLDRTGVLLLLSERLRNKKISNRDFLQLSNLYLRLNAKLRGRPTGSKNRKGTKKPGKKNLDDLVREIENKKNQGNNHG